MRATSIPRTLDELTSLRFFAAAYVVLFHALALGHGGEGFLNNIIRRGHLGVDLFFILSGFILAHVYLDRVRDGTYRHVDFLVNRFARFYPLHLFTTLLIVVAYVLGQQLHLLNAAEGMVWRDLPFHLLALHAWGFTTENAWNGPSWSISAELFAYLLFPVYALLSLKLKPIAGLFAAVSVFIAAWFICWSDGILLTGLIHNGIWRIFFEFGIGVAMYRVFEIWQFPRRTCAILWVAAVALWAFLAGTGVYEVFIVLALSAVIFLSANLAVFAKTNPLRNRVLIYLGEISYSTYLIHYLCLLIVGKSYARFVAPYEGAMPTIPLLIALCATYGASVLLYHGIERPARTRIRAWAKPRLSNRTKKAAAE